jgi:hypothetical protein
MVNFITECTLKKSTFYSDRFPAPSGWPDCNSLAVSKKNHWIIGPFYTIFKQQNCYVQLRSGMALFVELL